MALRIRSRWHDDKSPRSAKEIAGLLAANSWKIAVDKAVNLHGEHYVYQDDTQRLNVISELLIFQVLVIDRLIYKKVDNEKRGELVTELVIKLGQHVQENGNNMIGAGDYQSPFIDTFNRRSADYAECPFEPSEMNYAFIRCLGSEVQSLMGETQANRWVIDQIMDVDAPEMVKLIQRNLRSINLEHLVSGTE